MAYSAKFFEKRAALLAKNDELKRSAKLVFNDAEVQAEKNFESLVTKFKKEHPKFSMHKTSLMEFRDAVIETDLYKSLHKVPKGAIHHLHNMTGVSMYQLLEECLEFENIWYKEEGGDFLRSSKKPEGYISIQEERKKFNSEGEFLTHMADWFQVDSTTAATGNSIAIWTKFGSIFGRIFGFFNHIKIYKTILRQQFQACLNDGIYRVELRHGFGAVFDDEDKNIDLEEEIKIFKELEAEFQEKCPQFSIGIIAFGFKASPVEEITRQFEECFQLRKKYPELIMGFDLVQEENTSPQTHEFYDAWKRSKEFEEKYGIDCPFYFHAGETESIKLLNVADAITMGSKRIGHGLSALKFPHLVDEIKRTGMCIESCPLSNQVLGYVHDMRAHPCGVMLKMGVPISISNDDPGLFGYTGITFDFFWATLGWELSLRDVKQLCLDSIEFSGLDSARKEALLTYWQAQWEEYIKGLSAMSAQTLEFPLIKSKVATVFYPCTREEPMRSIQFFHRMRLLGVLGVALQSHKHTQESTSLTYYTPSSSLTHLLTLPAHSEQVRG